MVDETIERAMVKITKKLRDKLDVLKDNKIVLKLWNYYKKHYRKQYQSTDEDNSRLGKFTDNIKHILKENARFDEGSKSFKLHMNQYGDMDLQEFRSKMTGLKDYNRIYTRSLPMQRRKRFFLDSVKKRAKKIKDKIKNTLHMGKNRTDDYGTYDVTDSPVTRSTRTTKRTTTRATSQSMLDYRPYMNPIESQGQCG